MNISRADLYRLIIEEYVKEEGIDLSEDKADDLLAWIKGGEKPEYLDEDHCDNIWNMSTEKGNNEKSAFGKLSENKRNFL